MMRSFLLLLFTYTLCIYADPNIPSINDLMSIEDQQRTGVIKLSQKQKMELATWITEHCYRSPKCTSPENASSTSHLSISLNVYNGKILQLSDNSVWEVAPEDRTISQGWLNSVPLKLSSSGDQKYPYMLTNTQNHTSIKVRPSKL